MLPPENARAKVVPGEIEDCGSVAVGGNAPAQCDGLKGLVWQIAPELTVSQPPESGPQTEIS